MKRVLKIFMLIAVLGLALAATAPGASAAPDNVVGHVYVNNNTAGTNTISGFDRHADGSLTPMTGSPFLAGGAGTGTPTGSQGALQRSSDGRYLLAVAAGSNQISVLRIRPDGSLRAVGSGPVASNGSKPVSIAVHGELVYVANTGAGGSNYTGFTINPGGQLRPIPGSTFWLPDDAMRGDVLLP